MTNVEKEICIKCMGKGQSQPIQLDGEYAICTICNGKGFIQKETLEQPNILDDFETYEDYVADQYQSGYVLSDEELYYSREDFKEYKNKINKKETFESYYKKLYFVNDDNLERNRLIKLKKLHDQEIQDYKELISLVMKQNSEIIDSNLEKDQEIQKLKEIIGERQELGEYDEPYHNY